MRSASITTQVAQLPPGMPPFRCRPHCLERLRGSCQAVTASFGPLTCTRLPRRRARTQRPGCDHAPTQPWVKSSPEPDPPQPAAVSDAHRCHMARTMHPAHLHDAGVLVVDGLGLHACGALASGDVPEADLGVVAAAQQIPLQERAPRQAVALRGRASRSDVSDVDRDEAIECAPAQRPAVGLPRACGRAECRCTSLP